MTQKTMRWGWLTTTMLASAAVLALPTWAQEFIDPSVGMPPSKVAMPFGNALILPGKLRQVIGQPPANAVVSANLAKAAALLQGGQLTAAIAVYRPLVNTADEGQRAQARYGLAYALDQQGDDRAALEVLASTPTDESPIGQALGHLRGELMLQLADAAWWQGNAAAGSGTAGVTSWLAQYDRLTVQPNPVRAQRLRSYLYQPASAAPAPLTVAVLVPMSGPLAPVGEALLQGLQLGLSDRREQGGDQITLKPIDTAGLGGASAAAKIALDQSASLVVGPLRAAEVQAAAAILKPAGVPVVSFSSDARATGPGVWSAAFSPAGQAQLIAQQMFADPLGRHRAAGLVPDNAYGHDAWNAFAAEVRAKGGTVTGVSFFNPDAVDLSASLHNLTGNWRGLPVKGSAPLAAGANQPPFDALFMPVPAASLPLLTAQLSGMGLTRPDLRLLGTALWQDPAVLTTAGSGSLLQGWFAAPGQTPAFDSSYRAAFAPMPPAAGPSETVAVSTTLASPLTQRPDGITPAVILIASEGQDVGRLLADVALLRQRQGFENGGLGATTPDNGLAALLTRPAGFPGQAGYLRLLEGGKSIRGQAIISVGASVTDKTTKARTFQVETPVLPLAPLPLPSDLLPQAGTRGKLW